MSDPHSLTLHLIRPEKPGGYESIVVTWNGHIETVEENGVPMPPRTYLFEMDDRERRKRLAALRRALA